MCSELEIKILTKSFTEWKYGVIFGLYFPVFTPNTGKYGPEIAPYLGTFQAVLMSSRLKM